MAVPSAARWPRAISLSIVRSQSRVDASAVNDGSGGREPTRRCYDDMRFLQRVYAAAATLAPELVAAREAPHDGSSDKPRFSEKVVRNQ
jgi:hypothetical protein